MDKHKTATELDVAKDMGEKRLQHVRHMKAFAMKQGKCKEAHGGVCSYPHCQCLFVGLEDENAKDKPGV